MRIFWLIFFLLSAGMTSSCVHDGRSPDVGVSIGVNIPAYPHLVLIPGHPVYYDPAIQLNFFFYDGLYWVFSSDRWYASVWYNGPWHFVAYERVPIYVLRVPVRYYRKPPPYFRGWHQEAPPRWDEHWGSAGRGRDAEREWQDRKPADRERLPDPAPAPDYQRDYSGKQYPYDDDRQHAIRTERYRYEPREPITRERYKLPGKSNVKGSDRSDGNRSSH